MISADRADRLRVAGMRWHPRSGDRFVIRRAGLDDEIYTISDMMIEPHKFSTGTVLGFNGTTEWALDSVAQDDALWLPGEDQLRELLGGTFRRLARTSDGYEVVIELAGRPPQVSRRRLPRTRTRTHCWRSWVRPSTAGTSTRPPSRPSDPVGQAWPAGRRW